jgi:hypothetical protein
MFYDLEDPILFMKDIYDILADDGIWIFEQSYMPTMIKRNAYDTICHEHLEYYGLKQIKWMTDIVGFKIIDIELNNINGGSFCVTVAKNNNFYRENSALISQLLALEKKNGFDSINPYIGFKKKILEHKILLNNLVAKINSKGQKLFGYGASTKGNVLLQYCGFTNEDISYIAEVNEDKFDSFTPGSQIPIISEKEAKSLLPDYFLVLPWHFKDHIIKKESIYLESGGKLIFPLPSLEIIRK